MKKNVLLKIIMSSLCVVRLSSCYAALSFPQKTVATKTGIECDIKLAKDDKTLAAATKLLERQFGSATVMHRADDKAICVYLATKQLAGVLQISPPTERYPCVFINHIVVDKNHRNRGIGGILLDYLIQNVAHPIELQSENKQAARLYRRYGFISPNPKKPAKMLREYKPSVK